MFPPNQERKYLQVQFIEPGLCALWCVKVYLVNQASWVCWVRLVIQHHILWASVPLTS